MLEGWSPCRRRELVILRGICAFEEASARTLVLHISKQVMRDSIGIPYTSVPSSKKQSKDDGQGQPCVRCSALPYWAFETYRCCFCIKVHATRSAVSRLLVERSHIFDIAAAVSGCISR